MDVKRNMNLQMILLVVFVVVAVAATCYYAYMTSSSFKQKIQAQEEIINAMIGRFDNIESLFMRPPIAEVESIFEKQSKQCSGNVCTLTPFTEEEESKKSDTSKHSISNEELDELAKKELSQLEDS